MFLDYRRIENYPDYVISNYGVVYSIKYSRSRELKTHLHKEGYKCVGLYRNKTHKTVSVHSLVGDAFVGKREGELTFDHIDRNRSNNDLSNLRWATRSEQAFNRNN